MPLNEGCNGLPPPVCEPAGPPDYAAASLQNELYRVARWPEDAAYYMSAAICTLQNAVRRKDCFITPRERDPLLFALTEVRPHIRSLFRADERADVDVRLDAVAGLICLWAEPPAERASRHSHIVKDLHDYARQLRNNCHNRCLQTDIDARLTERIERTVADLLRRSAA